MNTPFRPQQIAIVGAGASGCLCAYFLLKAGFEVTIFDKGSPLHTLLPTGLLKIFNLRYIISI